LERKEALKHAFIGVIVAGLLLSSYFAVHYYNSSQALMERIQGATLEYAPWLHYNLLYATDVLESLEFETERENIRDLISFFRQYIWSAMGYLRTLRIYLLPSHENSLLIIEDLLLNMCVSSLGGVSGTFDHLLDLPWMANASVVTTAFKELNQVASEKIDAMGFELVEAFESLRRDHTVQIFRIIPSRVENAVLIANDLKTILNEWVTKYSQM
jgi:hypothetical protein